MHNLLRDGSVDWGSRSPCSSATSTDLLDTCGLLAKATNEGSSSDPYLCELSLLVANGYNACFEGERVFVFSRLRRLHHKHCVHYWTFQMEGLNKGKNHLKKEN